MDRSRPQLENFLRTVRGPALLVDGSSRCIVAANHAAARAYGYQQADLPGLPIEALWPAAPTQLHPVRSDDLKIARHRRSDGEPIDVQVSALDTGRRRGAIGLAVREISERAFTIALLESQSHVLEGMSRGASLAAMLDSLVGAIETLSGDMLGSVLLLADDHRHVRHGAAPHLPRGYWSAIDGLRIGPAAGSCGTAMYSGRQIVVADIATSPLWRNYRKLALDHGLRACWSTPILSPAGEVLGAFALYYREPRQPGEHEKRLVQVAAELASIAIDRRRAPEPAAGAGVEHTSLSARESQILRLIAQGEPVKGIASRLRLAVSTVYTHRAHIVEKLGITSNVALARYAVTHRLVH